MESAPSTTTAPRAEREVKCTAMPPADAPLPLTGRLVVSCFLICLAVFGLISAMDLLTSLFR